MRTRDALRLWLLFEISLFVEDHHQAHRVEKAVSRLAQKAHAKAESQQPGVLWVSAKVSRRHSSPACAVGRRSGAACHKMEASWLRK